MISHIKNIKYYDHNLGSNFYLKHLDKFHDN
jgi:hypothetical protein